MSAIFFYKEFNGHDLGKGESPLRKKFNTIIKDLKENKLTHQGNIKLISSKGGIKYLRAKLSDEGRLLFTNTKHNNKDVFVILEVIPNHDYENSRFLKSTDKIKSIEIKETEEEATEKSSDIVEIKDLERAHWLGKLVTFSATQEDIVKRAEESRLPLIVSGAAGSGKTSVALESLKKIQEKFGGGKILYITKSKNLIKESKKLFDCDEATDKLGAHTPEEIDFLSIHEFFKKIIKKDVEGKKPIDRSKFFSWFNEICNRDKFKEYKKDGDKIFEEFTAVIGGGGLLGEDGKDRYAKLGNRQSMFPPEKRNSIYDFFMEYRKFIEKDSEYYDPNLIAHECTEEKIYDAVVVDEVQDLTSSTLNLILKSLKSESKGNFLLCGDVNQVVHPSFFSLSKLKSFLSQNEYVRNQGSEVFYTLEKNYRNSEQVIELANRILHLKNYCFASEDKMTADEAFFMKSDTENTGNVSFIADDKKEEIAKKVSQSINWAVLVLDDEKKEEARKLFSTPLVFNIHEAKGLEFENVILYKFMSCKAYNGIWNIVCPKKTKGEIDNAISEVRGSYEGVSVNTSRNKNKEDKSFEEYKFYMNALYVGASRAIDSVYIMDNEKKCNLLKVIKPEKIVSVDIKKEESTPEQWKNKALELIDKGNIEQAESIEKKLQDKGEKKYAEEIMNALKAQGYHSEQAISELKTEPQKSSTMAPNEKREQSPNKKKITEGELEENTNRLFSALDNGNLQLAEKLHSAVRNGHQDVTELLLQRGANVNTRTKMGFTSLHIAAQKGYENITKLLLQYGADVNARYERGNIPLHLAAQEGDTSLHFAVQERHKGVAKLLLEHGANVNAQSEKGYTSLHYAVSSLLGVCKDVIELLLQYGADVNAQNEEGVTSLHLAQELGNKDLVKLLLKHGAKQNKNENQEDGIEALMHKLKRDEAVDKLKMAGVSQYNTQQLLIDIICSDKIDELKKIDISQYDKKHILEFSLQKSAFKITEFLIKDKGFTPENSNFSVGHLGGDDFELLLRACQYGFLSVAKFLLHYQSDHNKNLLLSWAVEEYHSDVSKFLTNKNAKTPLHEAVLKGKEGLTLLHKSVIQLLLEHGADVDVINNYGDDTPLKIAKKHGKEEVIKLLIDWEARVKYSEKREQNPSRLKELDENTKLLFLAFKEGMFALIEDLISKGINVNAKDQEGFTPLHLAVKSVYKDAAQLFQERGAQVLSFNTPTPHLAAKRHERVVQLLLDRGADINAKNNVGNTPLQLAIKKSRSEIIDLLIADPNINVGCVDLKSVNNEAYKRKLVVKRIQDSGLFDKVEKAAKEVDKDKLNELLKEIEVLLKPESKYSFKPSLNYSPDGSDKNTTIKIAIKAGGKLLQLLYDHAEKNIGKDTEIFKQLKHTKEHENTQPKSDVSNVSVSGNLTQDFKLGGA